MRSNTCCRNGHAADRPDPGARLDGASTMTTYTTTLSEAQVLDYFHAASRDAVDRLAVLQRLSIVVLVRPPEWNKAAIRRLNPWDVMEAPTSCFACLTGTRRLYWHHVIAVDHGGSATRGNLVAICYRCHRAIHPWLPLRADRDEARLPFTAIGALVQNYANDVLEHGWQRPVERAAARDEARKARSA